MVKEKDDVKKLERLFATREEGAKAMAFGLLLTILGHTNKENVSMNFGISLLLYGVISCIGSMVRIFHHDENPD